MIDKFENKECNGCKACEFICPTSAISYDIASDGFWYPRVDNSKCVSCGKCIKKCPNKTPLNNKKHDPIVKAAWSNDSDIRLASTSGGAFYEFAKYILVKGGYVVGCVYDDDFKGAHQTMISSLEDLPPLMVSKYVESDSRDIYPRVKKVLDENETVLFVGSPCQCAGLISFLGKDYNNLIVVDFLCRGANSPKAHRKYIEFLEEQYHGKMVSLRSKDKRNGWENFGQSALFDNGNEYFAGRKDDLRIIAYHFGNLMIRESCLDCKFKTLPRYSDITLGDFWGISKEEVEDIDKGVSLLFINSDKGNMLLESVKDSLSYIDKTLDDAMRGNVAITQSATCSKNRQVFLDELDSTPFDELVSKYRVYPPKPNVFKVYLSALKSKIKRIVHC